MTAPIRVCHLSKFYPPAPGGIETHVRTLAQAQANLGAVVSVFCINHDAGPTRAEQDGLVHVTRFGRSASVAKLDICPGLVAKLRQVEADILHMQAPNPAMILGLLAARPRQPLVVTYQSDVIRQRIRAALFRPLERLAYRQARAILPTSPTYAAGSRFLRPYRDRLRVLANGIEMTPYTNPSPEDRDQAGRIRAQYPGPLWLGVGRLIYYKGFLNAVRALTRVPGTLLLVGSGPEESTLRAEAARLGVGDRVVFLGSMPYQRIVPYYLAAEALWFPSNARSEAFGIAQVEAMASGCPVINAAIPHSGVAWVSRHEETGLTVPVDDPVAFAAAARRLLEEPGLRDRLAAGARSRALAEFRAEVMGARSLALYAEAVANPLPGANR